MLKTFRDKIKMRKRINKKLGMIVGIAGLLIMLISFSSAFGVSTSYWDENPLKIAPGESKIVKLGLQNKVGDEDITFKAKLTNDGEGIATIVDENLDYFVPLGESNEVTIQIEVPEDANKGITHTITISFTQVSSGEGGMVRLAGGVVSKFPVEIVGEEESELYDPEAKEKGLSGFLDDCSYLNSRCIGNPRYYKEEKDQEKVIIISKNTPTNFKYIILFS